MTRASRIWPFILIALGVLAPAGAQQAQSAAKVEIVAHAGHSHNHGALAVSPTGQWLATSGEDGTVKLWETSTARLLRTLAGHAGTVKAVVISPNGRSIASAGEDETVKLWDSEAGRLLQTLTSPPSLTAGIRSRESVNAVAFSPDGALLASGDENSSIKIWDIGSGKLIRTFRNSEVDFILSLAFSPDGKELLAGTQNGNIRLLDAKSGRVVRSIKAHPEFVHDVAFSPDGRMLASGGSKVLSVNTAKVWDRASGRLLQAFEHGDSIDSVAFSPDGRWLISSGISVKLWDVATGRLLQTLRDGSDVAGFARFLPSGQAIAYWHSDAPRILSVDTGAGLNAKRERAYADGAAAISDRQWLTVANSRLAVWDAETGSLQKSYREPRARFFPMLARDSSGRPLAVSTNDETLRMWDLDNDRSVRAIDPPATNRTRRVSLSKDARWLATPIVSEKLGKSPLILWEPLTGRARHNITAFTMSIGAVAFSPDGDLVGATGQDEGRPKAKIWDTLTGRLAQTIQLNSQSYYLTFSPNGRLVAADHVLINMVQGVWAREIPDRRIGIWDVKTGKLVRALHREGMDIEGAAFSPNGQWIVGFGVQVAIWETASGRLVHVLEGNTGRANSVDFSPDGRRLIVGNDNGSVTVWDAASGQRLVSTVYSSDDEWITITPEGFFVSSAKGAELLHVVRGFETFVIDQFYQVLYRPDLVREKLAGDPRGLVRQAVAQLDLNRVITSGNPPDVRLILPGRSLGSGATGDDNVSAEVEITDRGGGIGRVEWRVNGVTVGIDTPTASPTPIRLSRRLALDPGSNSIDVVAYNSANLVASTPARASIAARVASPSIVPQPRPAPGVLPPESSAPVAAAKPRLFVLAAGVNEYAEKRIKLSYAVSDAQEIARGIREASGNLYASVEVKLMTDAEVTAQRLDAAFAEMAGKTSTSDVFVLYLAGHGKTVDGRYYFIPQDFAFEGEFNDEALNTAVKTKGIAQEQWQKWFASVAARRSVILFDTCDSGTLAGNETQELERGAASDRLAQATGRSILAASAGTQEAIEGYRGHGLFTYNVLDAIHRSDGDNNGTVELNELAAFVYGQVSELSLKIFKQRQVPQMKLTGNYPLARPTRILPDEAIPVAEGKPTYQVAQTAQLQVQPSSGATVVRSLSANTRLTVLQSRNGWSLVASPDGKPIGYVATRDLAPAQ